MVGMVSKELGDLIKPFFPEVYNARNNRAADEGFDLQNGQQQLSPWFANIQMHQYVDALVIDDADSLVAYVLSLPDYWAKLKELEEADENEANSTVRAFYNSVENQIKRVGYIRTEKDVGMFEAK